MLKRLAASSVFAAATAASAFAGAWVYRDATQDTMGLGACPSCCEGKPEGVGQIADGRADFTGNQWISDGFGTCGDQTWRTTFHATWQSPPRLLAPGKPLTFTAALRIEENDSFKSGNAPFATITFRLARPDKGTTIATAVVSTFVSRARLTEASKTLTLPIPEGDAGQDLFVSVMANGTMQVGGHYWYHYVFDPNATAPAENVVAGPDGSGTTSGSDAGPGSGTTAGSDHHPASASGLGAAGAVLGGAAAATVIGGLLISLGTLLAGGLAGVPPGDLGTTLLDLVKGKLPADGFDAWQNKTAKIYGTGSPDDPFRDYPDPNNPPWKAPYGDGTAAKPFSDTAPAVIDRTPTPPDQPVTTTVDLKPVFGASVGDGPRTVIHSEPLKAIDIPLQKIDLAAMSAAKPPAVSKPDPEPAKAPDPPNVAGQLDEASKALAAAADQLKSEGRYVANGTLVDKVWYGLPHLGKVGVAWLGDVVRDGADAANPGNRQLTEVLTGTVGEKPVAYDPDPNWGQCGEAVEWGARTMADPIRKIFGPDAVFSKIELQSDNNPLGNHVANEVIAPDGRRYVVDMWETMKDGTPKIYREDEWIEAWKSHYWIGKSVTVTRGGTESSYQGVLEQDIRDFGEEKGLEVFRRSYKDNPGRAETIIKSYKADPWPFKQKSPPNPPAPSSAWGKFR